jgi:hypothetical protein
MFLFFVERKWFMASYLVHILLPGGEGTVDQDLLLGRDLQIHVTLNPPAHRGTTLNPNFWMQGQTRRFVI